ncbi:MAG: hypothetical protein ACPL8I_13575 [Chloroflexaceae bacterium]
MPYHRYLRRLAPMLILAILASLMIPPAAPARAAPERPIMAFYYPWWEHSDWSYSRMSDLPSPRYSGGDDEAIRRHVQ